MLFNPPVAPTRVGAISDSIERIRAIARVNITIRLRDPGNAITYFALPMILMVVLKPLYVHAVPKGGTTVIVTGLIVMFSIFVVGIAGSSILAERQWKTWDRLRQSRASAAEIALGKLLPIYVLMLVQQIVLWTYGVFVIGMPTPKSLGYVALSIIVWSFALLAMGAAIAVVARSLSELGAITDISAMLLSSLAGSLVPLVLMASWIRGVAHASPGYYALKMMQGAAAGDGHAVMVNAAVLIGIGIAGFAFAVHRLARGWGRTTML